MIFRPYTDYIIGADSVLHESEDLFTLIEAHEARPLKLYVYNTETDHCREVSFQNMSTNNQLGLIIPILQSNQFYIFKTSLVQVTITPNGAWGGEGSMGCGIGYGYLHRIPIDDYPQAGSHTTAPIPSTGYE